MEEKIFHLGIKALIRNQAGNILLLRVNQETFKNPRLESYWDLPGGRVLTGEAIEETLRREIEEETGITFLDSLEPLETLISNIEIPLDRERKAGLILSIYKCALNDHSHIRLSAEHTAYSWFSPDETSYHLSYKYPSAFTKKVKELSTWS
ncbi:MAG TPA: NUDIX domain-containing protein [Alphaproteobacteria bacterium]|nr:NUDIX domain-containing protein [Alphaproteobacteria bacterium]